MANSLIECNFREQKDYLLLRFLWFPSNKTHFNTDPSLWHSAGVQSTTQHFVLPWILWRFRITGLFVASFLVGCYPSPQESEERHLGCENPSLSFSPNYRQTMYHTAQGMKNIQPPLSTETYSGLIHDTNQQNAQTYSLDIYIMKSLWIFLNVVCNELSSEN
jgi:hypothetical protein